MKTVVHFIRKSTQLRASFIRNQILYHHRYSASVVYKHHSTLDDGGYAGHDTAAGLPVLDLGQGANFVDKALFKLAYRLSGRDISRILGFLDERRAALLHYHYGSDAGMYAPVMRRSGLPSVVSFYGYDCSSFPRMYYGYGRRFLRRNVFVPATRILAMSKEMRSELVALGCPEDKIIVHYFGSDIGRFIHQDRDYATQQLPIRLLILASFVPQKGHRVLLGALKELLSRGVSNFTLRMVGNGPLREELSRYVEEEGLSGHVSFSLPLLYGSPEMVRAYREADVFVHPSVTSQANEKEGIPGAIVEAMASGLPVISTFHSGIPTIIDNEEEGLLVPEYDTSALAEAISRVIESQELRERLGRRALIRARSQLDIVKREEELEEIYDKLLIDGIGPCHGR